MTLSPLIRLRTIRKSRLHRKNAYEKVFSKAERNMTDNGGDLNLKHKKALEAVFNSVSLNLLA